MKFTGERLIPDDPDHQDLYYEHIARYRLSCSLASGKRILDLACGAGYGADLLARSGALSVVGMDISSSAIEYAQSHYRQPNLTFRTADALSSHENWIGAFDLIVAFEVLEHIEDQEVLCRNLGSWLAPGGALILSTPNPDAHPDWKGSNPFHVRELGRSEFEQLLGRHFEGFRLFGQRRFEGISFSPIDRPDPMISNLTALENEQDEPVEYFIALCGNGIALSPELFEIPFFQDLKRLRHHLDDLNRQIDGKDGRIVNLQEELAATTDRAGQLSQQIGIYEQEIQDRDVDIANLERRLDQAHMSLGYRVGKKFLLFFRALGQSAKVLIYIARWLSAFILLIASAIVRVIVSMPGVVRLFIALPAAIMAFLGLIITSQRPGAKHPKAKKNAKPDGVSIVIPTWNGKELLEKNLPALLEATGNLPFCMEILIVDGGSEDGTAEFIESKYPSVRLIRLDSNGGFSSNANEGAHFARYELLYFLNNDMTVLPGFLPPLVDCFADEKLFAAASSILPPLGKNRIESGWTRVTLNMGLPQVRHLDIEATEPKPVFYSGGGAGAFRKDIFIELGGFDSLYEPFYGEDLDLSWRAARAGYRIVFHPQSRVIHQHRGTIGRVADPTKADRILRRNILLAAWRNGNDAGNLARCTLGTLPAVFDGELPLSCLFAGLKKMPGILSRRMKDAKPVCSDREIFLQQYSWKRRGKNERLNILVLSPYCPWPLTHGGVVRIFQLWKRVADYHRVHLLAFAEKEEELACEGELAKHFASARLLLRQPPDQGRLLDPNCVFEYRQSIFGREVDRLVDEHSIDMVCAEYPNLAHFLPRGREVRTVVSQIDILFRTQLRRAGRASSFVEKAAARYEGLRLFGYERNHARQADLVLAMSQEERQFLKEHFSVESGLSPNGVDSREIRYAVPAHSRRILFVGSFRHSPNVEGVRWFAEKVYPWIRERDRSIRWTLAGADPTAPVTELSRDPSITVAGFVPELIDLYHRCGCAIAPITRGSGTRLKILEAMAAGCPVVSTTIGIEGIEAVSGRDLLIADEPEDFALQVLSILNDPILGARLSRNARKLVEEQYDWDDLAANHARLLIQLAEGEA